MAGSEVVQDQLSTRHLCNPHKKHVWWRCMTYIHTDNANIWGWGMESLVTMWWLSRKGFSYSHTHTRTHTHARTHTHTHLAHELEIKPNQCSVLGEAETFVRIRHSRWLQQLPRPQNTNSKQTKITYICTHTHTHTHTCTHKHLHYYYKHMTHIPSTAILQSSAGELQWH